MSWSWSARSDRRLSLGRGAAASGSVELTLAATHPDEPAYVYDPARDAVEPGAAPVAAVGLGGDQLSLGQALVAQAQMVSS